MVRIGMDDDESFEQFNQDMEDEPDENSSEQVEEINTNVFIPQRRIDQFYEECSCVVVYDYGDEYHLSDEERRSQNKFYGALSKVRSAKHSYRRLDKYVKVCRDTLECLNAIAEINGIYSKEKFVDLFLKGEIYVNGLEFPKYRGKDKKMLSSDFLAEFILSDRPAEEILPKKESAPVYTEEDLEGLEDILFDEGELDAILAPKDEEEELDKIRKFLNTENPNKVKDGFITSLSRKDAQKLKKNWAEFGYVIKSQEMAQNQVNNISKLVYSMTADDIDEIDKYEKIHRFESRSKMPEFKGDLMDDDAYNRYLAKLDEWEEENTYEFYMGKARTIGQIKDLEFKKFLEDHNYNIRNLYDNKRLSKIESKKLKRDKKREKAIREKLVAIQERRKRIVGRSDDDRITSKRFNKKKKKKNKMKKKIKEYD